MTTQIEEEYAENSSRKTGWEEFYRKIKLEVAANHNYSVKYARKEENKKLNRYRDVSPYDHSRVQLEDFPDTDYINASLVEVPSASRRYILTQGPLAHTAGHFWKMVWQQGCPAVIMLNKIYEKGMLKCHQYYPTGFEEDSGEDQVTFPDVGMTVDLLNTDTQTHYTVRSLRLTDGQSGQTRQVTQYQYVSWPDFGVPTSSAAFLQFLDSVRDKGCLSATEGPAVIHCSAGIGRSGTFVLVDSALILVEKNQSLSCLDLSAMLLDMRQYRAGLIQTAEQLRFTYQAILDRSRTLLAPTTMAAGSHGDPVARGNGEAVRVYREVQPKDEESEEEEEGPSFSVAHSSESYGSGDQSHTQPSPPVRMLKEMSDGEDEVPLLPEAPPSDEEEASPSYEEEAPPSDEEGGGERDQSDILYSGPLGPPPDLPPLPAPSDSGLPPFPSAREEEEKGPAQAQEAQATNDDDDDDDGGDIVPSASQQNSPSTSELSPHCTMGEEVEDIKESPMVNTDVNKPDTPSTPERIEIRRRSRQERARKTEERLSTMRAKQQSSEEMRQSWSYTPVGGMWGGFLGVALVVAAIGYAYYRNL